jgi:hypothetical protein
MLTGPLHRIRSDEPTMLHPSFYFPSKSALTYQFHYTPEPAITEYPALNVTVPQAVGEFEKSVSVGSPIQLTLL